jgi:hypothetical protein
MSYFGSTEYLVEVAKGNISGASIVHKFGQYNSIPTTFTTVARLGVYQTPQAASATTLRVKAGGDANDTAAGTGAREITLEGLDSSGNVITETLATAGASASSATSASFMRLYRAYVSASGTYATQTTASHSAEIVIENGAGGTDWCEIALNGLARSQTEIGAYTIPTGYTGYLLSAHGFSDSSKVTEFIFFKRESILDAAAPYQAMRTLFEERLEGGDFRFPPAAPILVGSGGTDCGFMAKVDTGTAEVEVDFEILLIQD